MSLTSTSRVDRTAGGVDDLGPGADAWPTDLVTFAGITVDPAARMLFLPGRAPIALGVDQAEVLRLLMNRRGDAVPVERIERGSVNPAAITVLSLNSLLRSANGVVTIVADEARAYRLVDSAAEGTLFFADLRLNQVTRWLLVAGRPAIILSPQNAAVLELLMQAHGGPVAGRDVRLVSTRTAPGVAIGNLNRRLKSTGTDVVIVNDRSCGWRLVATTPDS